MREHLVAAFVCAHLTAVTVMAVPVPAVTADDLKRPGVQQWFDRVHERLGVLGGVIDRDGLQRGLVAIGTGWLTVREAVAVPARQYATWCGTHQSWLMFGDVPQRSARLVIERQDADGAWSPVYLPRSADAAWMRTLLEQERARSMINGFAHKKSRGTFKRLGRWLAPRLAADFPEAVGFRMAMEEVRFPEPEVLARTGAIEIGGRYWSEALGAAPAGPADDGEER